MDPNLRKSISKVGRIAAFAILSLLWGLLWVCILATIFQIIAEAVVDAVGSGLYTSI